jgi:phosphoglycerate dehydrogenase-like enzyme
LIVDANANLGTTVGRLRVVMATPLKRELCERIVELEPRIDLVWEPSLMPEMRFPTDYGGDPSFERTPEQQKRFDAMIDSAEALFGIPDLDPAALNRTVHANPGLRWVQTMAAGGGAQVKSAGLDASDLRRVTFTTSAGVHGRPLAEFALFGLLAGAKMLPRLLRQQRHHEWSERWQMRQLSDQTVLVLGLGGIGLEVVRLLTAIGCQVIATSRTEKSIEGIAEVVHPDDLHEVLPRVDGLVVTLPGTEATAGLVGDRVFSTIKPGATLVNVGRGSVVDESALISALKTGQIGYAALDVFAQEPLPVTSPLWDMPNVLISPHTAALNDAEERLIVDLFVRNAVNFLEGTPLINKVNTVEFY